MKCPSREYFCSMTTPMPPPISEANRALYYPIDDDPYSDPDKGIICYFCANRLEKEDYTRICLPNMICHCLCETCENKIDKLIVEIFGEGYESWDSNYCIKGVDPYYKWHGRYNMGSIDFFEYIVNKTDEYKAYAQAVQALCIWNKPDIKL